MLVQDFEISPGYSSTGFFAGANTSSVDKSRVAIPGTGGRILAVWYVTFTNFEVWELKSGLQDLHYASHVSIHGRRDCPGDSRRGQSASSRPAHCSEVYVSVTGWSLPRCHPSSWTERQLPRPQDLPFSHLMVSGGAVEGHSDCSSVALCYCHRERRDSGFAGLFRCVLYFLGTNSRVSVITQNSRMVFEAQCFRNSALYVSSRTLFVLAQRSEHESIRRTLGRTNNGHTPLAAIFASFLPGLLAFLAVKSSDISFNEVRENIATYT